jgi:hypothetical protein
MLACFVLEEHICNEQKKLCVLGLQRHVVMVESYQHFRGTYCLLIQCKRISFYTEDGGSNFLRKTGKYSYYITWCHNPDDSNLHSQYCESFKSHTVTDNSRHT